MYSTNKKIKPKAGVAAEADLWDDEEETSDAPAEECPKWKVLSDVIKEIKENCEEENTCRIMIIAKDIRTCSLLQEVPILLFS